MKTINHYPKLSVVRGGLDPLTTEELEQRSRYRSSKAIAASPRGDRVRPAQMSLTLDTASPTASPISPSVMPDLRNSRTRLSQMVIAQSLRPSVIISQRHSATEFHHAIGTMIGERIKQRREELQMKAPRLAKLVGIAASTLYDLERGDSRSSTKLHLIARTLGLNSIWLETGRGPRLLTETQATQIGEPAISYGADGADAWPLAVDPLRIDRLTPAQKRELAALIEGRLLGFESDRASKKTAKRHEANGMIDAKQKTG